MIRTEGEMSVEVLAQRFDVSAETIRRDLGLLAERGRVNKVHGGARRPRLFHEPAHSARETAAAAAKAAIGRRLIEAVSPGETLFIDTGSTTLAAAETLAAIPDLTIITNSWRLAERMANAGSTAKIFLLGGQFHADNAQTTGAMAIEQLQSFRADRAILTIAALDPVFGAMDADLDEAQIARAMIRNSQSLTILADATKFGRHAAHVICATDAIDLIITDGKMEDGLRDALTDRGVNVWT